MHFRHVTQLSANQIVNATTRDLHKLKILTQKGQKAQKLQAEKLMDNFKEAVAQYSSIQKVRSRIFSSGDINRHLWIIDLMLLIYVTYSAWRVLRLLCL